MSLLHILCLATTPIIVLILLPKRHLNRLLYTFILLLALGCSEEEAPQPETPKFSTATGTVYRMNTSIGIAGARVAIDNLISTTNADGDYSIPNIPIGMRTLTVEKNNFETYAETIQVTEFGITKNVELISLIKQSFKGTVYNGSNKALKDAIVKVGGKEATSDINGEFEIDDLNLGSYDISISNGIYYKEYIGEIIIEEGQTSLDFHLEAEKIHSVSSAISFTDNINTIKLEWNLWNPGTLAGFNIYYREWHQYQDGYSFSNPCALPLNVTVNWPSQWLKANNQLIESEDFVFSSNEFNGSYEFYVLPVNIDGVETERDGNGPTGISKFVLPLNRSVLHSFNFTDLYGPIEIENTPNEMVLEMRFGYCDFSQAIAGDTNWDIEFSLDGASWTKLTSFGFDEAYGCGTGSCDIPTGGAGSGKSISINQFKGQTVFFRTISDAANGLNVVNEVIKYVN